MFRRKINYKILEDWIEKNSLRASNLPLAKNSWIVKTFLWLLILLKNWKRLCDRSNFVLKLVFMCLKIPGCLWPSSWCDRIFLASPHCHSSCTFGGWIIWSGFYLNKSKFSNMYRELFTVVLYHFANTWSMNTWSPYRTTPVKILRNITWTLWFFCL